MTTPLYRIRDKNEKQYRNDLILDILNNVCSMTMNYSTNGRLYIVKNVKGQDDYIIERCTGMQEINGNRMYEGDIVTFGLDYKDIKYTLIYEGMQWKISDGANLKFATDGKDLEVIGNIHQ